MPGLPTHLVQELNGDSVRSVRGHPCPGNWVWIGRAVEYYVRASHIFCAGIKCRHCTWPLGRRVRSLICRITDFTSPDEFHDWHMIFHLLGTKYLSWLGVRLVISKSLVQFPAGALWSVLEQDSLYHITSVYPAAKWVPSIDKAVLRAGVLYAANCSGISPGGMKWCPCVQASRGGGRSCEHFGGYKAINGIPLPLPLLSIVYHITLFHIPLQRFDSSFKTYPIQCRGFFRPKHNNTDSWKPSKPFHVGFIGYLLLSTPRWELRARV